MSISLARVANAAAITTGSGNISMQTVFESDGGSVSAGDNIALGDVRVDSIDDVTGFTYAVENTTETYTLIFTGEGTSFSLLKNEPKNTTWSVPSGTKISLNTNSGYQATFDVSNMTDGGTQTTLQPVESHTIRAVYVDGVNEDATNYGVNIDKPVYSVDSYDGNATALCLPVDTLVTLPDGSTIEIGDVEEGMELRGFGINTLGEQEGDYLGWSVGSLMTTVESVTVRDVVFSFAKKMYSINGGELIATPEHPVLVRDSEDNLYKFKQIHRIVVGDYLIKHNGGSVEEIIVTDVEIQNGTEEIVTIDVEPQDTYLSNGFISHNKGGNTHTDLSAPGAPTGLSESSGTISWTAPSSTGDTGITAYDIQIDDTSTSFNSLVVNETEWSATFFDTNGVLSSGTYYVRVRAIDHGLRGSYTSALSITI
jgi:hypothetical protein